MKLVLKEIVKGHTHKNDFFSFLAPWISALKSLRESSWKGLIRIRTWQGAFGTTDPFGFPHWPDVQNQQQQKGCYVTYILSLCYKLQKKYLS